jgi:hypothetical protein
MSDPLLLFSSTEIKREELIDFLDQSGAIITPDDIFAGRISRDDQHIWIGMDSTEISNLEIEIDELESLERELKYKPKTCIVIEMSSAVVGEQLAIDFACMFMKRWPNTVGDYDRLYTAQQLSELQKANKGFYG